MKSSNIITKPMSFHLWSQVGRNIRRTPYQALVAIISLMFTFYAVTMFTLTVAGTQTIISHLESQPQVNAFFAEPPTDEQLQTVEQQIRSSGGVTEFRYVSQEEALELYKQQNQDNPYLLEMVNASILPASIEVSTAEPESLKPIADMLQTHELISEVIYQQDVIEEFVKWTNSIRGIGLEHAAILSLLSFFFIFVVISMKVAIKRREIRILQLVGARGSYISMPFILEGFWYGLIGALLGWGAAYTRLLYATPFLIQLFQFKGSLPPTFSWMWMLQLLAGELVVAGIWGATASWLAVTRYLMRNA